MNYENAGKIKALFTGVFPLHALNCNFLPQLPSDEFANTKIHLTLKNHTKKFKRFFEDFPPFFLFPLESVLINECANKSFTSEAMEKMLSMQIADEKLLLPPFCSFNLHATLYTQTINNLIPTHLISEKKRIIRRKNIFSRDFRPFFFFLLRIYTTELSQVTSRCKFVCCSQLWFSTFLLIPLELLFPLLCDEWGKKKRIVDGNRCWDRIWRIFPWIFQTWREMLSTSFCVVLMATKSVGGWKLLLLLCITIIKRLKLIGIFQIERSFFTSQLEILISRSKSIFHSSLCDNTIEKN